MSGLQLGDSSRRASAGRDKLLCVLCRPSAIARGAGGDNMGFGGDARGQVQERARNAPLELGLFRPEHSNSFHPMWVSRRLMRGSG